MCIYVCICVCQMFVIRVLYMFIMCCICVLIWYDMFVIYFHICCVLVCYMLFCVIGVSIGVL